MSQRALKRAIRELSSEDSRLVRVILACDSITSYVEQTMLDRAPRKSRLIDDVCSLRESCQSERDWLRERLDEKVAELRAAKRSQP